MLSRTCCKTNHGNTRDDSHQTMRDVPQLQRKYYSWRKKKLKTFLNSYIELYLPSLSKVTVVKIFCSNRIYIPHITLLPYTKVVRLFFLKKVAIITRPCLSSVFSVNFDNSLTFLSRTFWDNLAFFLFFI